MNLRRSDSRVVGCAARRPADSFDAIYIINLASRTDRRREMVEQMRIAGIDPGSPDVVFFDAVRPDDDGGFPTIGTRGCFLSHLGVLRSARERSLQRVLVLEDDLNFVHDFSGAFAKIRSVLESQDWGMAYLGALSITPAVNNLPPVWELPSNHGVVGAHMFAIQGVAISQAVDYLEAILTRPPGHPDGGPMHVDGAFSRFRRSHSEIKTLLFSPPLGYQRPSRTDIHALKWFDRTPVVRDLAALAVESQDVLSRKRET